MKLYKRFGDTIQESFTPSPQKQVVAEPQPPREIPGYTSTDSIPLYDVPPSVQHQEYQKENQTLNLNVQKAIREFQRPTATPPPDGTSLYSYMTPSQPMVPSPSPHPYSGYPYPYPYPYPQAPHPYPPRRKKDIEYREEESEEEEEDIRPRRRQRNTRRQERLNSCTYLKKHLRECKYCKNLSLGGGNMFQYKVVIGVLLIVILYLILNRAR